MIAMLPVAEKEAGRGKGAGPRVVDLDERRITQVAGGAAGDQHGPVTKQGGRVRQPRHRKAPGRREGAGDRIVNLGAGQLLVVVSADDQHRSVGEQGR
jgi:hypothetical protein